MTGFNKIRTFWDKLTHTGVQEHHSHTDIFEIRFLNASMGIIALESVIEVGLFLFFGFYDLIFIKAALLLVIGFSFYFQFCTAYKTALRCFAFGYGALILLYTYCFGGILPLSLFWGALITVVFFLKRRSASNYIYLSIFAVCIALTFVINHYFEPLLVLANLEMVEMIFVPMFLLLQMALINLFNNELEVQEQIEQGQKQELNSAIALVQSALESTTDGILVVGKQGRVTQFNEKFAEMWQIPSEVLASGDSQKAMSYVLSQIKEPGKFLTKINEINRDIEETSFDQIVFKDDRIVNRYSQPHRIGEEVVGRVWSFRDVTDQVKAEMALLERESLFKSLFDFSPVGVVVGTHLGGKLTFFNRKFGEMLGYPPEELELLTVNDITHPEDRGKQRALYQEMLAGKVDSFSVEKRYIRKDGSFFWGYVTVSLAKDIDGRINYDIVIIQDITEKRETENALKESEEKFRDIFEQSPFASILFENGKAISCNGQTLNLLKLSDKTDLLGKTITELSPEFQPNGMASEVIGKAYGNEAMTKGRMQFEWNLIKNDGEEVVADVTLTPFILNGASAIYAIFIDKTEQKANERKIENLFEALQDKNLELEEKVASRTLKLQKSNEELKRSNLDLEQFAYIASHDLQEPLRMVGNFVQLLQRQYAKELGKDGETYVQFAVDGVNRMSKLIKNLLNYSRVGRKDTTFETANLNNVIDLKILDLTQRIVDQKACVEMHELPSKIQCEPNQLGIVFYNLIGNAIKFNNSKTPKVLVTKEEKENEWLFTIGDNGIGIDSRYKDKVFQIFKRLHRREEYEGTGIGLSLCKRIINRHKGRIWFHSELGQGTTFYFTISKRL